MTAKSGNIATKLGLILPAEISPLPKMKTEQHRNRKGQKSWIGTNYPYKNYSCARSKETHTNKSKCLFTADI